jgi:two-component system phosphate regulon sensor histidine kinase PhoR
MFPRRSLSWPITLGVIMIVLLVAILVGWILLAVFGALADENFQGFYWILLSVGSAFLVFVLVGVVMYLTLTIKAFNLNRRQSNFIDSVTHELKSPIASLKLYLQTLTRHQVSDAERESFCRYMLEDVERLDQLINHLLDAARLEKARVASEIEDVELADVLRQCAETICLRYHVPEDTVSLDVEPCVVRAARVDLDLIFRNLIDNAVKYAGAEPRVEVTLRMAGDGKTVTCVSDNGRGIPHDLRRKIFGRFVRVGKELERDKPGTGLGLYIVRTLVSRLRGSIRVHDVKAGSGTMFEVCLPGRAAAVPATETTTVLPPKEAEVA